MKTKELEKENKELKKELREIKKWKKINAWTSIIGCSIILIILLFGIGKTINKVELESEIMNCIAENSVLYISNGCPHCSTQEKMLSDYNFEIIDCFYETEICVKKEVFAVPSWEIKGEIIKGKKSIEELKTLTGC